MSITAKRLIAAASTVVVLGLGFNWVLSSLELKISKANATIIAAGEETARTRTDEEIDEVLNDLDIEMTLMNKSNEELATMEFGLDQRAESMEFTEYSLATHAKNFKKKVDYIIINGENYYLSDPSTNRVAELAYNALYPDAPMKYN